MESANFQCANSTPSGIYSAIPTFPAFHLLRSYNYLMAPRSNTTDFLCKPPILQSRPYSNLDEKTDESSTLSPPSFASYAAHYDDCLVSKTSCGSMFSHPYRKQRGEKKPIPADQKDEKYYERRRRNNQAAKKSRDARKQREDQIALRATILEHENALLKAQLLTVREEASSLRQLLLEKKSIEFSLK
ncbi:transcription factor ces-2 [Onthophagus taurus]|uniref:transcription factor ces-2 n=1 Tax=Onthophagus taurus TaxID=166361 RepID=UPI0039BE3679